MNIQDLIEALTDAADQGITDVEIHTQPNYPLKGGIANVRVLKGKVTLATTACGEYGDSAAWNDADLDDDDETCPDCGRDCADLDDDEPNGCPTCEGPYAPR